MKKLGFLLLTVSALTLSAMQAPVRAEDKPAVDAKAADYVILKAGGEEIKKSEVIAMWNSVFPPGSAPDFESFDENIKQNVLRGMISERLLLKDAQKEGIQNREDVKKQIEMASRQITVRAYLADKTKEAVTDEKLKEAFDKKYKDAKPEEEVHARHILVKTEAEAKDIAEQLKKGGDFAKLAKEKSEDKGSGAQGGDLGFFGKGRMVKEFEEAAFKMKKGETSKPVKSDFGWHIIRVEDRRPLPKPEFEQAKGPLREEIAGKIVQDFVNGLLKKTEVEYLGADGKAKEFKKEYPAEGMAPKPASR